MLKQVEQIEKGILSEELSVLTYLSKGNIVYFLKDYLVAISPSNQVGPFITEFLVTGFVLENGEVVLLATDKKIPNGTRLY